MKLLYIYGKKIFYGFFLLEKKIFLMPFIFRKDNLKILLMPFRKENFFDGVFFRKETFFDGVFLEKKIILMPFLARGRIILLHAAPDPN